MTADQGVVLYYDCKKPIDQVWAVQVQGSLNMPDLQVRRCLGCFVEVIFRFANEDAVIQSDADEENNNETE